MSVAAGGDITTIKLVQGPLPGMAYKPDARQVVPLTRAQFEALQDSARGIEDKKLRAAIVSLGQAVLSASQE